MGRHLSGVMDTFYLSMPSWVQKSGGARCKSPQNDSAFGRTFLPLRSHHGLSSVACLRADLLCNSDFSPQAHVSW